VAFLFTSRQFLPENIRPEPQAAQKPREKLSI